MQGYGRYSGASPALARLLQYFRAFALAVTLQQPWVSARGCENTGHGKSVAPAAEQRWGSGNLSATVYRQPRAVEKPRPFPALGRRLGPARCHRFNAVFSAPSGQSGHFSLAFRDTGNPERLKNRGRLQHWATSRTSERSAIQCRLLCSESAVGAFSLAFQSRLFLHG